MDVKLDLVYTNGVVRQIAVTVPHGLKGPRLVDAIDIAARRHTPQTPDGWVLWQLTGAGYNAHDRDLGGEA